MTLDHALVEALNEAQRVGVVLFWEHYRAWRLYADPRGLIAQTTEDAAVGLARLVSMAPTTRHDHPRWPHLLDRMSDMAEHLPWWTCPPTRQGTLTP